MGEGVFNPEFFYLTGEPVELQLIDTYEAEDGSLPFYWWSIILKAGNIAIGKISFRIGHNYHSYYNGNIGYEIDEAYRGHHYALSACNLVVKIIKHHHMNRIYLTCDEDNIASYKTIEGLGAKLIEIATPPSDYIYYYDGMPRQRIYVLNVDS